MAGSSGEKSEKPTAKRSKKARQEGQIAKTPELGVWTQILVATTAIKLTFDAGLDLVMTLLTDIKRIAVDPDPDRALGILGGALGKSVLAVLPLALIMTTVGMLCFVSQTGLVLATKAIKPNFKKLNPIAGIKKFFKPQGIWQGAKAAAKLGVITMVAWRPVFDMPERILASDDASVMALTSEIATAAVSLCRLVAMVGLGLAAIDYAIMKWQNDKQQKMSKQDVKEENKQSEGDPQMKGQIRRRMQEMTQNRMLAAVPDASVVIVNPTHIAVALRYAPGQGAPTVVAKGKGHVALRIRAEAEKHRVPIVRDIMLARTLEKSTRIDQPVPFEMYAAVAHLLAFVMKVGKRASLMGGVVNNPHAAPVPPGTFDDEDEDDESERIPQLT